MRIEASEVKEKLYELLGKLEYGEENMVVITHRGQPVARLVDYYSNPLLHKLGLAKGKLSVPDDFDPNNEEITELFGAN